MGKKKNPYRVLLGGLKKTDHLENLGINGG
jgi:hypothetical protein